VWNLSEDAGAITRFAIGSDRATVREATHGLDGFAHHTVCATTLHIGHETDAAGVFFIGGRPQAPTVIGGHPIA
jgi:hypothetical protein